MKKANDPQIAQFVPYGENLPSTRWLTPPQITTTPPVSVFPGRAGVLRVLTLGTFDLFHYGHLRFLKLAAQFGPLQIGVNSDRFVASYKGVEPVVPEDARVELISQLHLGAVHVNDGPGHALVLQLRPDLLVVGSDWAGKDYGKQIGVQVSELARRGCGLCYLPYTDGISTSTLKQRIGER